MLKQGLGLWVLKESVADPCVFIKQKDATNPSNGSIKGDTPNPKDGSTTSRWGKSISKIDEANPNFTREETSIVNNPSEGASNQNSTFSSNDAIMNPGTTTHVVAPALIDENGINASKTNISDPSNNW